jgi:hypothetical protein
MPQRTEEPCIVRRDLSAGTHFSSLGLHEQNHHEQKVVLFLGRANCLILRPFCIPCSIRHTKNIGSSGESVGDFGAQRRG